jgi:hypothetical protein
MNFEVELLLFLSKCAHKLEHICYSKDTQPADTNER